MKEKKLNQKAMLVHLTLSEWRGRARDASVSKEVQVVKEASNDCGTWWTQLLPKWALKNVRTAHHRCRAVHNHYTLPWQDGGYRILPAPMFMEYSKQMRKASQAYDDAVDAFVKEYPKVKERAIKRLGKLADTVELPTAEQLRGKFGHKTEILPLPDAGDFRVEMAGAEVERIKKQIQSSVEETTKKAVSSVWEQLKELVSKVEETMGEPDKRFRNTLISNLAEYCDLIPKFNLTEDDKLTEVRKEVMTKLATLQPDDLREDKKDRKAARKAAQDVLNKMQMYA